MKCLRAKVKFIKIDNDKTPDDNATTVTGITAGTGISGNSAHKSKNPSPGLAPLGGYSLSKPNEAHNFDEDTNSNSNSDEVSDLEEDQDSIFIDDDTISYAGTLSRVYRNWKVVLLRVFCVVNERIDRKVDSYTKHRHDLELGKLFEQIGDMEDSMNIAKDLQEQTELHVASLKDDIEVWKKKTDRLQNAIKDLQQELEENIEENAGAHSENRTLRIAVHDGYRKTKSEIARVMRDNDRRQKEAEDEIVSKRRQKSTHISCITCEYKNGTTSTYMSRKQCKINSNNGNVADGGDNGEDRYENGYNQYPNTTNDGDNTDGNGHIKVPLCVTVGGAIPDETQFEHFDGYTATPSAMSPTATTNAVYNPQYNQHGDRLLLAKPRKINGIHSIENIVDGPIDEIVENRLGIDGNGTNTGFGVGLNTSMAKYSDTEPNFAVAGANIYTGHTGYSGSSRPQSAAAALSNQNQNQTNPMFYIGNNRMMGSSSEKDLQSKTQKAKEFLSGTMIPSTLPTPSEHLSKFTRIKNIPPGAGTGTGNNNGYGGNDTNGINMDTNTNTNTTGTYSNIPGSAKQAPNPNPNPNHVRPSSALLKPHYNTNNSNTNTNNIHANTRPQSANLHSRPSTSTRNVTSMNTTANMNSNTILSASLDTKDNKFNREIIKDTKINPVMTVGSAAVGEGAQMNTNTNPNSNSNTNTISRPGTAGTASGVKKRLEDRKDRVVGASLIQENMISKMGLHANMGYTVLNDYQSKNKNKNKFAGHRNTLGAYQSQHQNESLYQQQYQQVTSATNTGTVSTKNNDSYKAPPVFEINVPKINGYPEDTELMD